MAADLIDVLPPKKGVYFLYGGLAGGTVDGVDAMALIYHAKRLQGWLLTRWLLSGSTPRKLLRLQSATSRVMKGLSEGGWSSSQFIDCTDLESVHKEFSKMLGEGVTGTKLRILFQVPPPAGVHNEVQQT
jgi:hypothetical protein